MKAIIQTCANLARFMPIDSADEVESCLSLCSDLLLLLEKKIYAIAQNN